MLIALSLDSSQLAAASKVEHVSGNLVEFEMGSLAPGTRYTVEVQAVKEAQKSDSAVTEFTTSKAQRKGRVLEESLLHVKEFLPMSDEPSDLFRRGSSS